MSPRTKHLIAALFLVLLTIPVVYTALTWSPQNPLRIRIATPAGGAPLLPQPNGLYLVPVIVENTCATPVHATGLRLIAAPLPSASHGEPPLDVYLLSYLVEKSIVVPPRGTALAVLPLNSDMLSLAEGSGSLWAGYIWFSGTKVTAMRFPRWFASRIYGSWYDRIPLPQPNLGSAQVDVPAGTAAAFGITLEKTPASGFEGKGPLSIKTER